MYVLGDWCCWFGKICLFWDGVVNCGFCMDKWLWFWCLVCRWYERFGLWFFCDWWWVFWKICVVFLFGCFRLVLINSFKSGLWLVGILLWIRVWLVIIVIDRVVVFWCVFGFFGFFVLDWKWWMWLLLVVWWWLFRLLCSMGIGYWYGIGFGILVNVWMLY